ncbi:hypothetical protein L3Q82_003738 [Scomber scombrus]|uniref:Uncharacterized protein n=1 Tax=Scomber scombrus TaxID=13677 RepID=A0AAV1QA45_SCOSC
MAGSRALHNGNVDFQQKNSGQDLLHGLAGCGGLVLVLCDLRQQDRVSLAAGEENRCSAAGLTAGGPEDYDAFRNFRTFGFH